MAVTTKESDNEKGEKVNLSQAAAGKPQLPEIIEKTDMGYEQMDEAYAKSFKNITEGEVVKGTILKVTDDNVVIDVGFKSEGVVSIQEFRGKDGVESLQPGGTVEVLLERAEGKDGHVILSREKAERMKIWDTIEIAYQDQSIVKGRVIERIKGGLAVDIGVRAFLPGSQVDLHPVRNLDSLRGEELEMRVIKVNKRRGNIVLSRKAVLEEVYFKQKEETLKRLEEGLIVAGKADG